MTTTARLLTILALSLPLAACAAQPAPRIAAPMDQAAKTGQDGTAGSAAAPSAAPATQAAAAPAPAPAPTPAAGQHAADNGLAQAQAQAPSTISAPQPRRSAGAATAGAVAAAAPSQASSAPAAEAAAVPAPAANAPALNPASPAAPETTVGGGAANRPAPAAGAVAMPASSATGSLLQTLLALIVVLGVLGALAWFLKRYGPKAGGGNANLRVVGALNLGGRERVLVVEVGDQWIVVGASPGRINALATMPKQENADMTSAGATLVPHSQPANSFADWLKQTIDKRK